MGQREYSLSCTTLGRLEKLVEVSSIDHDSSQRLSLAAPKTLFEACDNYLQANEANANTARVVEFDRERVEVVKHYLDDTRLSSMTRETIDAFQAQRRVDGASNRTVTRDVGALRRVLKRFKNCRRLEDDVKMLTESGGEPMGRVLTAEEQDRLLEVARVIRIGACVLRGGARREHVDARYRH